MQQLVSWAKNLAVVHFLGTKEIPRYSRVLHKCNSSLGVFFGHSNDFSYAEL